MAVVSTNSKSLISQKRRHAISYVIVKPGLKDEDDVEVGGRNKASSVNEFIKNRTRVNWRKRDGYIATGVGESWGGKDGELVHKVSRVGKQVVAS